MQLHPFLQILILVLLALWPVMRLYKRVGLNPLWALLLFFSLLIPFLGVLLAMLPLTFKKWPHFPDAPKPLKPVKRPI